jgi:replicative DNA helicase
VNMQDKQLDADYYESVMAYNMLLDESYLANIIDHIDPKFFNNKDISSVVEIIIDFYKKRSSPPTLTEIKGYLIDDRLKQCYKNVIKLFEGFDKKFNKDELYTNTERFLKERAVYNTLLEVAEQTSETNLDTGSILNKFEKACNITLSTDLGLDYFNDIEKHIKDLKEKDSTVSSGWSWLDKKLDGGFLEKGRAIYVFAGETNIGKSIFLGNIARNIAESGKCVLLVSLEMSELVYAKRITTNLTQIPIRDLNHRTDDIEDSVAQYKRSNSKSKIIVKEFPPSTITCRHLKGFIKKLTDRGVEIDAIVVDYVNLLKSESGTNSYERIKYATEELRALSYVYSCPIITATQLNRQGYNEINPGLDTVGESYGLAATADAIFSIWREEEDIDLGVLKLGVMKNRFGENHGSVIMEINYDTLTLKEGSEQLQNIDMTNTLESLNLLSS